MSSKSALATPAITLFHKAKHTKRPRQTFVTDLHKELEAAGIVIDRHSIQLDKPIKKSGKTVVEIKLNAQVIAQLTITVDAGDVKDED